MEAEYYTREEFLDKLRQGMAEFKFGCAAQKAISGSAMSLFSNIKTEVTWKDIPLECAGPLKPGVNHVKINCPHCGTEFGATVVVKTISS
jgi:uncharacterized Zn-finger protein